MNLREHIENRLRRNQKMTTTIAIKCIDGIAIANDSQRTLDDGTISESPITKFFKINENMGLGGSGKTHHIDKLIKDFKKLLIIG
jgi:20S proteasome alpha/beta subunit